MLRFATVNPDLQLALELADAADAVTMRYFRSPSLAVRTKADRSPVTEADEATERAIRDLLGRERPEDGILGEELGPRSAAAEPPPSKRWILDPIDATGNYLRGVPIFATLIALEQNGSIEVGVVSAPALQRRWWAARNEGAYCNGERIRVSTIASVDKAFLASYNTRDPYLTLARQCGRVRDFGDFWSHMLVAEGVCDIATDPIVAAWDVAPIQVIVEEAGGRFTDMRGNARHDGGSGLSTNGALHDAVLEILR